MHVHNRLHGKHENLDLEMIFTIMMSMSTYKMTKKILKNHLIKMVENIKGYKKLEEEKY